MTTAITSFYVLTMNTREESRSRKLSSTDYDTSKQRHNAALKFLSPRSETDSLESFDVLLTSHHYNYRHEISLVSKMIVRSLLSDIDESVSERIKTSPSRRDTAAGQPRGGKKS